MVAVVEKKIIHVLCKRETCLFSLVLFCFVFGSVMSIADTLLEMRSFFSQFIHVHWVENHELRNRSKE